MVILQDTLFIRQLRDSAVARRHLPLAETHDHRTVATKPQETSAICGRHSKCDYVQHGDANHPKIL